MQFDDFLNLYTLDRQIGCGQFSRIFSATRRQTGQKVFVKFLLRSHLRTDGPKIEQDLIVSKSMESPYLVKVFDVFENEKVVMLVLEPVIGRDLFQWILKRGYISESATAALATHILLGLKVLHDHNIMHLDLKPENILVVESPGPLFTAKLTDYCLAATIEADQELRGTWQTEACTAPEVITSDQCNGTADIWSLGVILFIILSGNQPFTDCSSKMDAELAALPDVMEKQEWSLVSDDGKDFLLRCLRKDPTERLTVDEALSHPWLTTEREEVALPEVLRNFQITAMGRKVVRAIGAFKKVKWFKRATHTPQDQDQGQGS
jgi:serine/threonine protein kinase